MPEEYKALFDTPVHLGETIFFIITISALVRVIELDIELLEKIDSLVEKYSAEIEYLRHLGLTVQVNVQKALAQIRKSNN
jgi:hypothetical protein